MRSAVLAILLTASLVGCQTVTKAEYEKVRAQIVANPKALRERTENCRRTISKQSVEMRTDMARLAEVPVKSVADIVCMRMARAVRSGRLSYQDVQSIMRQQPSTNSLRILKGG